MPEAKPTPQASKNLLVARNLVPEMLVPIVSRGARSVGVAPSSLNQPCVPAETEIAAIEEAARLASIALERPRVETSSRTGYEDFRALIENTSDVISVLDVNGVIRYLSPSVRTVLGFDPSELIGNSGFSCFHPYDLAPAH